ncbi:ATP-binding protein, partial [Campylobacter lari]
LKVNEFEDLLINKPTIMKIFKDYMQSLENLIQEKKVYIKNLIIEFENKKTMIEKIKSQISKL